MGLLVYVATMYWYVNHFQPERSQFSSQIQRVNMSCRSHCGAGDQSIERILFPQTVDSDVSLLSIDNDEYDDSDVDKDYLPTKDVMRDKTEVFESEDESRSRMVVAGAAVPGHAPVHAPVCATVPAPASAPAPPSVPTILNIRSGCTSLQCWPNDNTWGHLNPSHCSQVLQLWPRRKRMTWRNSLRHLHLRGPPSSLEAVAGPSSSPPHDVHHVHPHPDFLSPILAPPTPSPIRPGGAQRNLGEALGHAGDAGSQQYSCGEHGRGGQWPRQPAHAARGRRGGGGGGRGWRR